MSNKCVDRSLAKTLHCQPISPGHHFPKGSTCMFFILIYIYVIKYVKLWSKAKHKLIHSTLKSFVFFGLYIIWILKYKILKAKCNGATSAIKNYIYTWCNIQLEMKRWVTTTSIQKNYLYGTTCTCNQNNFFKVLSSLKWYMQCCR